MTTDIIDLASRRHTGTFEGLAAPSEAHDPIFAAIEAHRKACVNNNQCVDLEYSLGDSDPMKPAAALATSEAIDEMFDLARKLLEIPPATAAGAAALLDYVSEGQHTINDDWRFPDHSVEVQEDEDGESFHIAIMKHLASALTNIASATPARLLSDESIFAAIEEHRSAVELEKEINTLGPESDRFYDEVFNPALDKLVSSTPETPRGLATLMAYIREKGGVLDMIGDHDEPMLKLERSIELAACNWAGLPRPIERRPDGSKP